MHFIGKFDEKRLSPIPKFHNHSEGYTVAPLIDQRSGSVHTELAVNQLAANGTVSAHVHSYEEGFYILSGRAVVMIGENTHLLGPGDYGAIKVGTIHAWRNAGSESLRWLQMAAPQPKTNDDVKDTWFLKGGKIPTEGKPFDPGNRNGSLLGHFDMGQIPPMSERRDVMPGLEGVFLNWLIDSKFGASHHRMAFIEYQPGVGIGPHDHTFEESYFILDGEIEGILDGEPYVARPGDVLWTGVGCVHSFKNKSNGPVRWIETFSPQPPAENAFRFMAEWEKRAVEIER
ncbi:MAG TPA: cupin domain-containing protein [Terriglobia bacterium]|nr:cupin domain-containing protein [Terriglobia bacterium]